MFSHDLIKYILTLKNFNATCKNELKIKKKKKYSNTEKPLELFEKFTFSVMDVFNRHITKYLEIDDKKKDETWG